MAAVRSIFLSDLHLGLTGSRAAAAHAFLKATPSERLYLVGDIVDLWVMRRRIRWDPIYNKLARHVLKRAQRGQQVVYLPGNHDAGVAELTGLVNIHRGVDCRVFTPARRDERRRVGLGAGGKLLVLYVGRLAVEKGMDALVPAFRMVYAAMGERTAFCVAGDGPEGERVRRELPFARHLGFLDRATLADLYADADLFVFPSATETCGLVALEAMASGLPVIGAAAGGMRDNVREGVTGRLVPPGDAEALTQAIVAVLDGDGARQAMGRAARDFAVERDWERELDLLVRQYEALIGRPAANAAA